jgi:succinyl-diaminopimelate desuccinylase
MTAIDANYGLSLLSKLVSLDTNSIEKKNYKECAELICNEARSIGLNSRIIGANAPDGLPRPNVVVDYNVKSGKKPAMLLLSHFDVVPAGEGWKTNPFKLVVKGGKAFGRGASDDKGGVAACMGALKSLSERGSRASVRLACTCDEEVSGEFGAGFLAKEGFLDARACLVVDGSVECIEIGTSAPVFGRITVFGKQGHAAYPNNAENAIEKALPLLNSLKGFANLRRKTVSKLGAPREFGSKKLFGRFSVTMLSSGVKENVIPGKLEARFDLRCNPDESVEKALGEFRKFFNEEVERLGLKALLEFTMIGKNRFVEEDNWFAQVVSKAASATTTGGNKIPFVGSPGGNDGAHVPKGIPVVSFSPIAEDTNFHGANEFIRLSDLKKSREAIARICESL